MRVYDKDRYKTINMPLLSCCSNPKLSTCLDMSSLGQIIGCLNCGTRVSSDSFDITDVWNMNISKSNKDILNGDVELVSMELMS